MRNIAISISVVVATLMTCEVALSGQTSSWFGNLFQDSFSARLEIREAELKALMKIRSEQETAWLGYILARRQYAKTVNYDRRQELMNFAAGDARSETTLPTVDADNPVLASKLALKEKFDALYTILDEAQRARADSELTPDECGR